MGQAAGDVMDRAQELVAKLSACVERRSGVDARIAGYMLANLRDLPFETGVSLAEKAEVSAASITRFCRSIGFANIKALKDCLKSGPGEPAWLLGDRLREFHRRSLMDNRELSRALEKEIAAITAVYAMATTPEFQRAVRRLAVVPRVHVAGFQTERGHATQLVANLQYIRAGVHLADQAGGHFADVLLDDPASCCLVLFDGRRYSRMMQDLAFAAMRRGIPVTLVTDPYCRWARGKVSEIFEVPTDLNHFGDTTSAMASLIGLMLNGVFRELGAQVEERLLGVSRLYSDFVGHVGDLHATEKSPRHTGSST